MDLATGETKVSARAADLLRRDEAVEAKGKPCTTAVNTGTRTILPIHIAYFLSISVVADLGSPVGFMVLAVCSMSRWC
jgi:hypothetical protein